MEKQNVHDRWVKRKTLSVFPRCFNAACLSNFHRQLLCGVLPSCLGFRLVEYHPQISWPISLPLINWLTYCMLSLDGSLSSWPHYLKIVICFLKALTLLYLLISSKSNSLYYPLFYFTYSAVSFVAVKQCEKLHTHALLLLYLAHIEIEMRRVV